MDKKTIIIGGVAGGATTAARLRRNDENRNIIIYEKGEYISYANCGLPYYIGDNIKSRDALLLMTPEAMKDKFNVDVKVQSEVIKIVPNDKKIIVKDLLTNNTYEDSYDDLVIATGSSPIKPPISGIEADNILTLWSVPDTDAIKNYINEHNVKNVAVIGGGFIGLEMAENLHDLGLKVSIIEMQNQVMTPIDLEMANLVHENIVFNNVNLILNDGVKQFIHIDNQTTIELTSGKKIKSDLIILSIGVRPNSQLALEAGLQLNDRKGIVVNDYLQTSDENIYAVGDVIGVTNYVTKEQTMIPLAGPANKQARILADNLVGKNKKYNGTLGSAVAKVFDLTVASVGLNEKQLKLMGKTKNVDYFTCLINQKSHAGYYPNATPLTLKMIFNQDGKIYGGQIVGQDGVDKRIDTLATTMRLNGTIYDLCEIELAYAPPFSSAKDPINMLGFVAENIIDNLVKFIEYNELDAMINDGEDVAILDICEDVERMIFSIDNSIHIPFGQIRSRIDELDKNKLTVVYCAIGVRSYNVARILMQKGFSDVRVLSGGTSFYKSMHYNNEIDEDNDMNNKLTINDEEMTIIDCCGLQCPGPIMKVNETLGNMVDGQILKVSATDMGFAADINAWCKRTGNTLIRTERVNNQNIVYIKKGSDVCSVLNAPTSLPQGKTIIVFSGDLDKVLASFIIANGARAMGRPVTMFFTFWGLNALRKSENISVKKPFIEKMFALMMPKGSRKLKLSKMNMGGMGTMMMKKVMNDKNVESLEDLMKHALDSGIKLVACTMSMDIMGITKEELLDNVEYAGVASYLGDAEESNVNLFI
ncbi:MAG: DsrE/DsrF/DrsH-like family protein [Erysipelotrichaceae bacterium]